MRSSMVPSAEESSADCGIVPTPNPRMSFVSRTGALIQLLTLEAQTRVEESGLGVSLHPSLTHCHFGPSKRQVAPPLLVVGAAVLMVSVAVAAKQGGGNNNAIASLKGVPVPQPAELAKYVADPRALIVLGKALFWDAAGGQRRPDGVRHVPFPRRRGSSHQQSDRRAAGVNSGGAAEHHARRSGTSLSRVRESRSTTRLLWFAIVARSSAPPAWSVARS